MFRKEICYPIISLSLLSLGGWLVHVGHHSPAVAAINWLPAIIGFATTFILPFMFNYSKTARWAFLITVIAVIGGTITMADFSFDHPPETITLGSIIFQTIFPDILILWAKLPIALSILQFWRSKEIKA
jgi:hypothetical protein